MLSSLLLLSTLSFSFASNCSISLSSNSSQVVQPSTPTTLPSASLDVGSTCACDQLASSYPTLVLRSNASNYSTENLDFWDVRSADLKPKCMFLPTDADMVAAGVSVLASCGSQFAIRGGGHMNFPGANNINNGVLLSLGSLTNLKISDDNSTIAVGPGNRWVDVYGALAPLGLYTIGGRMKTIGVSGLTLIGGYHYFNNKYGMAMDNVVSYSVVLGNGTQVVATATDNPELFWSLKGGAGNFGIVTEFAFKTISVPMVSTTIQNFEEPQIEDFITAVCNLADNDGPELGAGSIISISYNLTTKATSASLLGVQEGTETPPSRFANFTAIEGTSKKNTVMPPATWHNVLESPNQMFRIQFGHKTMLPDAAQVFKIYQAWKEAVDTMSDIEGFYPTFVLNFLPKSAISVAKNNGVGNVWGLDDDKSWLIFQFSTGWASATDDLRVTNWARSLLDYYHLENQNLGLASDHLYMGDAGEYQDPFEGMPLVNVQRMRAAREVYDPLGVFTRLAWGGFKLGN